MLLSHLQTSLCSGVISIPLRSETVKGERKLGIPTIPKLSPWGCKANWKDVSVSVMRLSYEQEEQNGQEGSAGSGGNRRGWAAGEHRCFKAALTRQVRIIQRFCEAIYLFWRFVLLGQAEVRVATNRSVVCSEPLCVC